MNAPEKIVPTAPAKPAEVRLMGLHAPVLVDRVSDSVRLLVGLVAGFGACTPVSAIQDVLEGLGRADAHLVLQELGEKHDRVRKDVALMHPELLGVLERKCS
ncbi:MAG: hypothetical protein WA194_03500 [Patescibacteria group bacterium]